MSAPVSFASFDSAVAQFLFDEANLLDEGRFQQWLALWAPDGRYWMPCDHSETDPAFSSSIINDDFAGLKLRVDRLNLPNAHSMSPSPIGCRVISNVVIESRDALVVRSKQVCLEFQRREQDRDDYRVFAATVRHRLIQTGGAWRIQLKHVLLIDSSGARPVMPVPL